MANRKKLQQPSAGTGNPFGLVKPEITALPSYPTGTPDREVQQRYGVDRIARLASNENPFGTSPLAREAMAGYLEETWKYSDPGSVELRAALGTKTGVGPERILIGNGSEELIGLICRACLREDDRVITVHPSFLLHEIYPLEQGAAVVTVPMTEDFRFDIATITAEAQHGCKLLVFSNPSNPVGTIISTEELKRLLESIPEGTLIVIDEAYFEYANEADSYPDSLQILDEAKSPYVILRTFSKAFGLAGLRVGYGLCSDPWFREQLDKVRTPFNVNSLAQVAACAALEDDVHLKKTISYNRAERRRVIDILEGSGYRVADSLANFIFIDSGKDSLLVATELEAGGIIVKPWTAEGYETFLRVTIGTQEDNERFLRLLLK